MNEVLSTISDILNGARKCECGRTHASSLKKVVIGEGALEELPSFLKSRGAWKVGLVADELTYEAAGKEVSRLLESSAITVKEAVYPVPLIPDEEAFRFINEAFDGEDCLIGAGAGTVNDLTRYAASQSGRSFVSIPTAPSVDGFASAVSALIVKGVKTTLPARMPEAVFADIGVLRRAPLELITAGYGDMIGKITSLLDWSLSRLVTGDWHCPWIEGIVKSALNKVIEQGPSLARRDPYAISVLVSGLVLSGIAIELAGSSRPASGSEHHLSHYWEMRGLWSGSTQHLHGIKVGAATPIIAHIYWTLLEKCLPDVGLSPKPWEEVARRIDSCFGPLAGRIREEARGRYADTARSKQRVDLVAERWEVIRREILPLLTPPEEVAGVLKAAGAASSPQEVGIPYNWVRDGILAAKEVRNRYTVLQLADDLGMLEPLAEELPFT